MNVKLGSNDFFGVPFPLVLADRFFHIYPATSGFKLDLFRWDEELQQPFYEVKASTPLLDNISTNPTGIVTFSEPTSGTFQYKFRPKPRVSQIFGKVPIDKEFEVLINDRMITVMAANENICTLQRNQFSGPPIGIQVGADGSIAISVSKLPNGMKLIRA
jgi:hypothetical protein